MPARSDPLLQVGGLRKSYPARRGVTGRQVAHIDVVDDVSLHIDRGETLAVVGESGAGKSTLGRLVLRLIEADAGTVDFDGVDIRALGARALRRQRRRMQMIFQDPYSSLDPKMSIAASVAEPVMLHGSVGRAERRDRVLELLTRVGLREDQADHYPYELSGGQLQRVAVARALATDPQLIVCDEPVAALDVSIRAQVINLLRDLQDEHGLAYLFISHDLSLVRTIAHRVAVMRAGRIVEIGPTAELFANPRHEYTADLLAAVPVPDPRRRNLIGGPAPDPQPPRDRGGEPHVRSGAS